MSDIYYYYNGDFVSAKDMGISPKNRSFQYGDALFESMRLINNQVPFLKYHLKRMRDGAKVLQLEPAIKLEPPSIAKIIDILAQKNESKNARLRLSLFRREGGYYTPDHTAAELFLEFIPTDRCKFELNTQGISIDTYRDIKKPDNPLSRIKSSNSLLYIMAGLYAKEKGLDDCLLLSEEEMVIETINSNIFVLQNKSLYTPPLDQNCLPGVMRQVIIELAQEIGWSVSETPLNITQVQSADEVMLTNAIKGPQWVGNFREKKYESKHIEELLVCLNNKYCQ